MCDEYAEVRLQGVAAVVWELRLAVGALRGSNRQWTARSSVLIGEIEECSRRLTELASATDGFAGGIEVR